MKQFLILLAASSVIAFGVTGCSGSGSSSGSNNYTDADGIFHSHQKFFDIACSKTVCTQTANIYVTNVDGLFVEPSDEYVKECLQKRANHTVTSTYCKYMYSPGDSEKFPYDARLVKYQSENGFNPPNSEDRIEKAREKLDSTLI